MGGEEFKITFWGVRGSYPVSGTDTIEFGGHTPCLEVEIGDQLIILDAGTGITRLGRKLESESRIEGKLFISHVHWDHIQGFPFFRPAFNPRNQFKIYGRKRIRKILARQMESPYFPIKLEEMNASLEFNELTNNQVIKIENGAKITPFIHPHPDGAFSFRIEYGGKVCCYLTDIEPKNRWEAIVDFVSQADLVVYDSHFTDSEYLGQQGNEDKLGWGHSTWQEGIRIIEAAGVKTLVLFHHAPWRTDKQVRQIEQQAQNIYSNTLAAQEGMVIDL